MDTFYYTEKKEFLTSSFVEEAYYNVDTTEAVFVTPAGESLVYSKVDEATWDGFINAPSQGRYFQQFIKGIAEYHQWRDYTFFNPVSPTQIEEGTLDLKKVTTEGTIEYRRKVGAPDGKEYTIVANFSSFEAAHTLFSYAESTAKSVSLSVYADDANE